MDIYENQLTYLKKVIAILLLAAAFFLLVSFQKENVLTIYVSAGAENGNGTKEKPLGSLEDAKLAVRNVGSRRYQYTSIVIEVDDGEYLIDSLVFENRDGGTKNCPIIYKAKNPRKVILNGGLKLDPSQFETVGDQDFKSRLNEEAAEKVVCFSLFDLGISAEDYGKIGAVGSFNTAAKYGGDWVQGPYCELFYNDKRMPIARYPNEGFVETETIVEIDKDTGSEVYTISRELSDRVASWETTKGVWMFGYWAYDWADASTPIGFFNAEGCNLSPKFRAYYATDREDVPFYFFNVPEELDIPGEWYLDRDEGILYLYPFEDFTEADLMFTLSTEPLIKIEDANYLSFDGFVVEGSRGDGIDIKGDNNTISNCLIRNVGSDALIIRGSHNLAYNNEITGTGKGGIVMEGGDIEKLISGGNIAENNLIHDWSQIYFTYHPAVRIRGVGHICTHNEIYNSPHEAIHFSGNNHVIEYNDIHDVCLLSSDAGAIYAGRHWEYYGTGINYNYIHDIGAEDFKPNGIYLDDNLSGTTVFGNIICNLKGNGILLGGGRDLDIENNLIVSCKTPIVYDARAIRGTKDESYWYANGMASAWETLYQSPWRTEIWQNAYPQIARFSDDFSNLDDPNFVPNPAYSIIINNVEYQCDSKSKISEEVLQFSEIAEYEDSEEIMEGIEEEIFTDPENGNYSIREDIEEIVFDDPNLKPIPYGKIGIQ